MKIAILDDYQDSVRHLACFGMLDGHEVKVFNHPARGIGQMGIRLAPFDAIVLIRERSRLPGALLRRLPNLRLISQAGRVGGQIDVDAAMACGIAIAEGVGDPAAPAELTWALILAASRRILPYAANLRGGLWQTVSTAPERNGLGTVLKGRTLGIWGYGRIGRLVAGYGRAFGMNVLVWGSDASLVRAANDGCRCATSRQALFAQSDVLSLHLRLGDATRGIVTASDFSAMKPDALFVNTSRAELVAEGALFEALQRGRPAQAAVDVFETEPLPPDAPLLRLPNVLATPHIGYVERDSYELIFRAAFQNILDFANSRPNNLLHPAAGDARDGPALC